MLLPWKVKVFSNCPFPLMSSNIVEAPYFEEFPTMFWWRVYVPLLLRNSSPSTCLEELLSSRSWYWFGLINSLRDWNSESSWDSCGLIIKFSSSKKFLRSELATTSDFNFIISKNGSSSWLFRISDISSSLKPFVLKRSSSSDSSSSSSQSTASSWFFLFWSLELFSLFSSSSLGEIIAKTLN